MTPQHERLVEEGLAIVAKQLDQIRQALQLTVAGHVIVAEIDDTTKQTAAFVRKIEDRYRAEAEAMESSADPSR